MAEEKKEVIEEEVSTEEQVPAPSKEDFEKENEVVPTGKYNQTLRKLREAELEKKELEKRLAEKEPVKEVKEEEDEDFFKEEEEEKKELPDPNKLIDEKLKPVFDTLKKREESDRKIKRSQFFEAHPEYLKDSEKWQGLLDEMDNSINPNSNDDYYTQLEKTHRIISGDAVNAEVEDKKKEMAGDATSSGDGAEKGSVKDEFTAEDKKYMKEFNVSVEGMRAYKDKIKSGSMRILS
jgi:hypothetical protein